jgi:shikimate dehydrogenase
MTNSSATLSGKAKKAGVMGWPVGHSKSPALHGFWLQKHGIDGAYVPMAVKPSDLAQALKALPALGFAGVNLTAPHKEAALSVVDEITDVAKSIGAINTVFVTPEGKLRGTNTDAYGFMENLRQSDPSFATRKGTAVVLGAGGAARAVCAGLIEGGWRDIRVANRTIARAQTLAADFSPAVTALAWEDIAKTLSNTALLVNATSLGMTGQGPLHIDLQPLPTSALVTDLVYAPLETALLAAAKASGNPTVDGLGMLLYQAQVGFEGWFGVRPIVTPELRAHVLASGAT